jgi:hypothetical protein
VFGNALSNTQTFTGSVGMTGSLTLNNIAIPTSASLASTYLPLTGGTLTGALGGTSAAFSGVVTDKATNISADGAGVVLQGYVDNTLRIAVRGSGYNDGARGGLYASTGDFGSSVTVGTDLYLPANKNIYTNTSYRIASWNTSGVLYLGDIDNGYTDLVIRQKGTAALTFSGTQAATFASSVTANNDITINAALTPLVFLNTTSTGKASGILTQEGGTSKWAFGSSFGSGDGTFNIYNYGAGARYLTIATSGAATFSSTISAGSSTFSSGFATLSVVGTTNTAPHSGSTWTVSSNQDGLGRTIIGTTGQARAMYFENNGSIVVPGALSKGSGTFKIDHPLESKKDTHQLIHSFVEGPRADLIYRGKVTLVNSTAIINIDESAGMTEGTFVALNRDVQCFTTNETGWGAVKGKVEGNILTITSQNTESTDEISWMVIGERQDKHIKDTDWTDADGKPILEPLKS